MTAFGLLAVTFIMDVVAVLFVLCCIALILIVLIQKGKGGGLSGAFGGAMASGILGSKTGDFLTWVTIVLAGVFLSLAVIMAKFYKEEVSGYGAEQPVQQQMPANQRQAAAANEIQVKPGATGEINAPGGSQAAQPGAAGEKGDVNLPGN